MTARWSVWWEMLPKSKAWISKAAVASAAVWANATFQEQTLETPGLLSLGSLQKLRLQIHPFLLGANLAVKMRGTFKPAPTVICVCFFSWKKEGGKQEAGKHISRRGRCLESFSAWQNVLIMQITGRTDVIPKSNINQEVCLYWAGWNYSRKFSLLFAKMLRVLHLTSYRPFPLFLEYFFVFAAAVRYASLWQH